MFVGAVYSWIRRKFPMRIGLLGFGVVGRGVYDLTAGRDDIKVAKVVCLEDVTLPDAEVTRDFNTILNDDSIDTVVEGGQASISLLQRKLRVGYARAGHLIDTMEKMGVVGASEGSKPRRVLITAEQWRTMAGDKWGMPSDGED